MMYAIAVIAIQLMTLLHVVRSGRTQPWLFVVLFLPLVGSVAYLIAEVLPEFLGRSETRRAIATARDSLDPERRLRDLREAAETLGTAQSFADYARELSALGRHDQAHEVFGQAMTGLFAGDPEMSYLVAVNAFEGAEQNQMSWDQARQALAALEQAEEKFRAKDRALLRARLAAATGDAEKASEEFRRLTTGYAGPEIRVRFAHFLYTQGQLDEAKALLDSVLAEARRSSAHVRQMNAFWFRQAEAAVKTVSDAQAKA
jgi:hypothetical protein